RRRHTRCLSDWSSDVCSSDLTSLYRASLVLLGFAPLLGVYSYTSQWMAPILAQGSALLALACGGVSLRSELARIEGPRLHVGLRSEERRVGKGGRSRGGAGA